MIGRDITAAPLSCRVNPIELEKAMLGDAVELRVGAACSRDCLADAGPSFEEAKKIADAEAKKRTPDPMLLAWFDKKSGIFSPRVE